MEKKNYLCTPIIHSTSAER